MPSGSTVVLGTALFLVAVTKSLAPCAASPDPLNWPQWRGPGGGGVWKAVRLPALLSSDTVKERWSVPIGGGYAGVSVAAGRVVTLDRPAGKQAAKPPATKPATERVLCFDRETGKELWKYEYAAQYGDLDHGNGPRSTPTIEGDRVYTLGALGRLHCLELMSGRLVWDVDLQTKYDATMPIWGHSVSPLIVDDRIVIQIGGKPNAAIVAVDKGTGAEIWKTGDDRPGYSTPIQIVVDGVEQLAVWTADNALGIDPKTGSLLWEAPFRTSSYDVAIASPVFADGQLFLSGYWDGSRTFRLDGGRTPRVQWEDKRKPSCLMATPLYHDGHLYALDRRAGLLCVEWRSGKGLWSDEHKMTPEGRNPHASMVWAGSRSSGVAAILNAPGELIVAELSPKGYQERGRVPIIGFTWAHPAFSGQDVFARSDTKIVCVRIVAPSEK